MQTFVIFAPVNLDLTIINVPPDGGGRDPGGGGGGVG